MRKKPNILILMSDEHRFDIAGFAGNKIVRTPFLDELAKDAVIFNNAYTPSPVCIPARQCIAAGQYPKTCKVNYFGEDLVPNYCTFARVLSENGYKTVAAGKLHHMGEDQMQGWMYRIAGDCEVSAKHFRRVDGEQGILGSKLNGVDPSTKWNEKKEILRAAPGNSGYARRDQLTITAAKNFIYEHFIDSYYDRATPEIPLTLYVGLLNPHYPYIAEEELFNYYLNRVEPYIDQEVFEHQFLGRCTNCGPIEIGSDVSHRDITRAMAAYYANIETIDRQFGEVITALREAGEDLDEWIIIYTTDHGEMLGEHCIWEKQKFFEGSVKVPFWIRYPKKYKAQMIEKNVNLVDIFATICDLTGTTIPEGLDSRSLVPLLQGDADKWKNETISQWTGNKLMIKWDDIKYQLYTEDGSEIIFDLKKDPSENKNLMGEEQYQELVTKFRERAKELGFERKK